MCPFGPVRSGVEPHALVFCSKVIMELTVLEAVLPLDVLEHAALLQPRAVEHRLAAVLRQSHLLKPVHQLAASEAVHHGPRPAPSLFNNVMTTLLFVVFGELKAGHPNVIR